VSKSYAGRQVKPRSIVPFQLDRRRRRTRSAVAALALARAPATSSATRRASSLTGVYLPFWTYDCETASDYTGQRGEKRDKVDQLDAVSGHVDMVHMTTSRARVEVGTAEPARRARG
jgi:hypothetical protein